MKDQAEKKIAVINKAYKVLSNEELRTYFNRYVNLCLRSSRLYIYGKFTNNFYTTEGMILTLRKACSSKVETSSPMAFLVVSLEVFLEVANNNNSSSVKVEKEAFLEEP